MIRHIFLYSKNGAATSSSFGLDLIGLALVTAEDSDKLAIFRGQSCRRDPVFLAVIGAHLISNLLVGILPIGVPRALDIQVVRGGLHVLFDRFVVLAILESFVVQNSAALFIALVWVLLLVEGDRDQFMWVDVTIHPREHILLQECFPLFLGIKAFDEGLVGGLSTLSCAVGASYFLVSKNSWSLLEIEETSLILVKNLLELLHLLLKRLVL